MDDFLQLPTVWFAPSPRTSNERLLIVYNEPLASLGVAYPVGANLNHFCFLKAVFTSVMDLTFWSACNTAVEFLCIDSSGATGLTGIAEPVGGQSHMRPSSILEAAFLRTSYDRLPFWLTNLRPNGPPRRLGGHRYANLSPHSTVPRAFSQRIQGSYLGLAAYPFGPPILALQWINFRLPSWVLRMCLSFVCCITRLSHPTFRWEVQRLRHSRQIL